MDGKHFLRACKLIKTNLVNLDMNRAFNSIGSNVFFEFGKGKEVVFKNGKKSIQKEWSIWISHASWRMTKKEKYIIGSGDAPQDIQSSIQKLLGKRFRSFQFLSQFLDVEFNFEDEYQLTTFFNWAEEDQWTLFLPDQTNIGVDCSSPEAIKNVQEVAEHLPIAQTTHKKLELPNKDTFITDIDRNEHGLITLYFTNETSISLENCTWRIEKNKNYLSGCLDGDQNKIDIKTSVLIGKKLNQIDIINSMMDAVFKFEDQIVMKIFTCYRAINQWNVYYKNNCIFHANIQIFEE
jgi:hypothetical protein